MSNSVEKNSANDVECPHCGQRFALSEAVSHGLRDEIEAEYQAKQREAAQHTEKRIAEAEQRANKIAEEAQRKAQAAEEREKSIDARIDAELKTRGAALAAEAAKKAEQEQAEKLELLQQQIAKRDSDAKAAQQREIALMRAKAEAEEAGQKAELNAQRKLEEEREAIRRKAAEEAAAATSEKHRLKELESEQKINGLMKALEDAQRKGAQGSMETQGEALEQEFESQLSATFPNDTIAPVKKGAKGGDVIHTVNTGFGTECGKILWEMKNTKAWSGNWIPKLKDDMTEARASVAVLVSVVLPEGVKRFGLVEGVWVSDPLSALPLAGVLRDHVSAIAHEREASSGKGEKMEQLYEYMRSEEFRQKIEGIVDAFTAMGDQIARERRAMEAQWKAREKALERVIKNTSGMYGDLKGIIGGQFATVAELELDGGDTDALSLPEGDEDAEAEAEG